MQNNPFGTLTCCYGGQTCAKVQKLVPNIQLKTSIKFLKWFKNFSVCSIITLWHFLLWKTLFVKDKAAKKNKNTEEKPFAEPCWPRQLLLCHRLGLPLLMHSGSQKRNERLRKSFFFPKSTKVNKDFQENKGIRSRGGKKPSERKDESSSKQQLPCLCKLVLTQWRSWSHCRCETKKKE